MLESHPSTSPGTAFGYGLVIGLILVDAGLLLLLVSTPVTILSFVWGLLLLLSLPGIAVIVYWTTGLSSAQYHVEENTLLIEWGRLRHVVPLQEIQSLNNGREALVKKFRGLRWPGYYFGRGHIHKEAEAKGIAAYFYATRPLSEQLLLFTENAAYGISPVDVENFTDCLEALRTAKLNDSSEIQSSDLGILASPIWHDRSAQALLAMAVLFNLLLFAYLTGIFGRLPAQVPLHFNALGAVDRLAAPGYLFTLPLIGFLTWGINGFIGWLFYQQDQQVPAYLSWGTAVLVQLATWGAVLGLLA